MSVAVHERVSQRHPELSERDVRRAWSNAFLVQERIEGGLPCATLVALGADGHGRVIEMVAVMLKDGTTLIYHAMTPPSKRMLKELRGSQR